MLTRPLTRPLVAPLTEPLVGTWRTGGFVPDFVIDEALGDDGNDGTAATPWASLNKINSIALVSGTTTRVVVKAGTYSKATDFVLITAGSGVSNCTMEVRFETGCAIDGVNYPANTNCIGVNGTAANYTNIWRFRGNGCTIRNVLTATGNGLGGTNGGTVYFYGFDVANCVDGTSSHGDTKAEYEDCIFAACTKSPCANIQTTQNTYRRCTFDNALDTATAGALVSTTQTPTNTFEDCVFLPGTAGIHRTIQSNGPHTFIRCQLGTLARSLTFLGTGVVNAQKCFLNVQHDANFTSTYNMCFGGFSLRQRNLGAPTMTRSVIVRPATGFTNVFYSNFDPTAGSIHLIVNNIFEMNSAWMSYDATNSAYLVTEGSQFFNNILFGGAVYDADLIAAGAQIAATITSDPLIGAANTLLMADYAFGAGSPAIGSATPSGDRGFGASEVEERHVA